MLISTFEFTFGYFVYTSKRHMNFRTFSVPEHRSVLWWNDVGSQNTELEGKTSNFLSLPLLLENMKKWSGLKDKGGRELTRHSRWPRRFFLQSSEELCCLRNCWGKPWEEVGGATSPQVCDRHAHLCCFAFYLLFCFIFPYGTANYFWACPQRQEAQYSRALGGVQSTCLASERGLLMLEETNNEKRFEFFDFDNGAIMNFSLTILLRGEETKGLEIKWNLK